MGATLSFGKKISGGFAAIALLGIVIGVIAIGALRVVTASKDSVIDVNAGRMLDVAAMRVARERRAKHVRSYLISLNHNYIDEMHDARDDLLTRIESFRSRPLTPSERDLVERVASVNADMQEAWDTAIAMRKEGRTLEEIVPHFEASGVHVRALDAAMNALYDYEARLLFETQASSSETSDRAVAGLAATALFASACAAALAFALSRALKRQVGSATKQIQSSSMELTAAARQQATSSKELAATTVEIVTTMRELLVMSRQISTNAERAAQTAADAGERAHAGDMTVQRAQEAIRVIRRQVDAIVGHMTNLGRRSQQIGGILDLIDELAEQTNILAINATIESMGAGESGKRFGVVASEIRRLADRVGGSAREIRSLIQEIRNAAGTTLAATEDGSRAVDSGAAQFDEVLSTFRHITERVAITTDVAREITLSIQQQTSAVEQVNSAVAEVAAAAKESESSSGVTLHTSSELTGVAQELASLIGPALRAS